MDNFEIPEVPEGAKKIHDDCGYCGARTLHIESRLESKPIGSFSLSGAQMKVSAASAVVLVCRSCRRITRGTVDRQGYAVFPDEALATANKVGSSVTITGSRSIEISLKLEELFRKHLGPMSELNRFLLGGAVGLDSHALVWLAENTRAHLLVVVPDTLDRQPRESRLAYERAMYHRRDERSTVGLVELGLGLSSTSYHKRNRWMVDRSSQVVGFVDRGLVGGTGATVRYANGLNKTVNVVPV